MSTTFEVDLTIHVLFDMVMRDLDPEFNGCCYLQVETLQQKAQILCQSQK